MSDQNEIIELTEKLLNYIDNQNWDGYLDLTDETLSCIEPETSNKIVLGLDFHKFYFNKENLPKNLTFKSSVSEPYVRLLGETAMICYIRKLDIYDTNIEKHEHKAIGETRIWNKSNINNKWKMVHFHKSI